MNEKKYNKIDPRFFEMPMNRLLDEQEINAIKVHGIESSWISCKQCRTAGGTTDNREFCCIDCYCLFYDIDKNAMKLLKNEWLETIAAKSGDKVEYQNRIYKVVSTDFNAERLKRSFKVTYSYILIGKEGQVRLSDIEYPLRKMGYGDEILMSNKFGKDETDDAK